MRAQILSQLKSYLPGEASVHHRGKHVVYRRPSHHLVTATVSLCLLVFIIWCTKRSSYDINTTKAWFVRWQMNQNQGSCIVANKWQHLPHHMEWHFLLPQSRTLLLVLHFV